MVDYPPRPECTKPTTILLVNENLMEETRGKNVTEHLHSRELATEQFALSVV